MMHECDLFQYKMILINAKLISTNKVIKTGHISRLNKNVKLQQYGYDEIYKLNGRNYITIAFFTRGNREIINTGVYYPMFTYSFKEIFVKKE